MRVRAKGNPTDATKRYAGYYNYVRRKPGDVFDLLDPKHFSEKWMERVDPNEPKTPAPGEPTAAEIAAEQRGKVEHDLDRQVPLARAGSRAKSVVGPPPVGPPTGNQEVI
ncbi:MAG TPA: hypothetical protein VNK91_01930 [Burkholderiaceae bacterium]|nr:hypothetical protein [Burkholderiaceae bacterium]